MNFSGQLAKHVSDTAAKSKKHGSKKVKRIEITKGENGGFIARNHMDNHDGPYEEPKEYPLTSTSSLVSHIKQHMCMGDEVAKK